MIRFFLILFSLLPVFTFAQKVPFYQALDQWVKYTLPQEQIEKFGYIFYKPSVGFLLKNRPEIDAIVIDEYLLIGPYVKLDQLFPEVIILNSAEKIKLKLPEFSKSVNFNSNVPNYLYDLGYHFNHNGANELALRIFLKLQNLQPSYTNLAFELGFAYNALYQHEEAYIILKKAISQKTNSYGLYRELGYAALGLHKIPEAEKAYLKAISLSNDLQQMAEMAMYLTQAYYDSKNDEKFYQWLKITRMYGAKFDKIHSFSNQLETTYKRN